MPTLSIMAGGPETLVKMKVVLVVPVITGTEGLAEIFTGLMGDLVQEPGFGVLPVPVFQDTDFCSIPQAKPADINGVGIGVLTHHKPALALFAAVVGTQIEDAVQFLPEMLSG
ncbi:hypothetical protein WDW89_04535 [Deltaproteobacteria bacterium TL4]